MKPMIATRIAGTRRLAQRVEQVVERRREGEQDRDLDLEPALERESTRTCAARVAADRQVPGAEVEAASGSPRAREDERQRPRAGTAARRRPPRVSRNGPRRAGLTASDERRTPGDRSAAATPRSAAGRAPGWPATAPTIFSARVEPMNRARRGDRTVEIQGRASGRAGGRARPTDDRDQMPNTTATPIRPATIVATRCRSRPGNV